MIITAKEAKNRLGAAIDSALSGEAVVITKHDCPAVVMLSARDYWALVKKDELSFDEKFGLLADAANGEISVAEAMSKLCLTSKKEFDDLSIQFGIGLRDKLLDEKHARRLQFFADVEAGKAKPSDAFVFHDVSGCKVTHGEGEY